MNIQFPVPPAEITQAYMIQVLDIIRKAFVSLVSKDQSVSRVLLESPNGTVYEITVSDLGVVTTAVNSGKTRDI